VGKNCEESTDWKPDTQPIAAGLLNIWTTGINRVRWDSQTLTILVPQTTRLLKVFRSLAFLLDSFILFPFADMLIITCPGTDVQRHPRYSGMVYRGGIGRKPCLNCYKAFSIEQDRDKLGSLILSTRQPKLSNMIRTDISLGIPADYIHSLTTAVNLFSILERDRPLLMTLWRYKIGRIHSKPVYSDCRRFEACMAWVPPFCG